MFRLTNEIQLNTETNTLVCDAIPYSITEKEKRLLVLLVEKSVTEDVVTREEIIPRVWPERHNSVTDTNILQLVSKLRRTLRFCGLDAAIHTVLRQGYRFIPDECPSVQATIAARSPAVKPPQAGPVVLITSFLKRKLMKIMIILPVILSFVFYYCSIPAANRAIIKELIHKKDRIISAVEVTSSEEGTRVVFRFDDTPAVNKLIPQSGNNQA
ncbi:TPA: winged helix-turn-helix domain-containing protein [Serratia liquefaciens]|nr:winged helix-turn-helix domain-containing protein [Serratia liquefaciens]